MLTGRLVRVRFSRDRIIPAFIDADSSEWHEAAERLLEIFRTHQAHSRGELEAAIKDAFGDDPSQLVPQGLAKLLDDRCEFEVVSGQPPEQLREAVFREAARLRQLPTDTVGDAPQLPQPFDRQVVLQTVAGQLGLPPDAVHDGLFADLKSEQRLVQFKDISAERLLQRYNVSLAQAVLLRSTKVRVEIHGEPPRRLRQLLRMAKFHRLVCDAAKLESEGYALTLDGPLSLFSATQKYGLQLALFLPAVLPCREFTLQADLLWGPQRKSKKFVLTADDGLTADHAETGVYVPPEIRMFADLFRQHVPNWDLVEETDVIAVCDGFWVPDFRLVHRPSGKSVFLEILGFWRRSGIERHLERLKSHIQQPFLLAVSDQLHVDDAKLEELPVGVHRFRQMPQYEEIAKLADAMIQ